MILEFDQEYQNATNGRITRSRFNEIQRSFSELASSIPGICEFYPNPNPKGGLEQLDAKSSALES